MRLRIGAWPDAKRRRRSSGRGGRLTAAAFVVLTGCSSIEEPPEVVTAEAELQPSEGVADPVTGSVALVIQARQTQIGIGVRGGKDGTQLGWSVRNGSCSGTGQRIGPVSAFPPIDMEDGGEGEAETVIFRRIPVDEQYAAEVFDQPDAAGTLQACADLVPGE